MKIRKLITLMLAFVLVLSSMALMFGCSKIEGTAGLVYEINDDGESYTVVGFGEDVEEIPTEIEIASTYEGMPVTAIGARAFQNCSSVTKIVIPDSIKEIGASAFYGCKALKDLDIPASVESFGTMTFYNCKKLTKITIPKTMTVIPGSLFFGCESITEMEIPDSITTIQTKAFGESGVKKLVLPNSVTDLQEGAFKDAAALEEVVMGSGVVTLGSGLFDGCTSLSKVTIGEGVKAIYSYAFAGCESLTSITIPAGVRAIYQSAFEGCINLRYMLLEGAQDTISEVTTGNTVTCPASQALNLDKTYHSSFWRASENAGSAYVHNHWIFSHDISDPNEAWKFFVGFDYGGCAYTLHNYLEPEAWTWDNSTEFYWYNGTKGEW